MNIVQILPELNSGGVERGTLEVARYLAQRDHQSTVISNGGKLVKQLEAEGSHHLTLPVHKKRLGSLKQVAVLRRVFETLRPDVLHLRSRLPAWLAYLAWRKMDPASRPRLVSTVHGFYSVNAYSAVMTKGERVICVSESVRDYVLEHYPKTQPEKLTVIPRGVDPTEFPYGYQAPGDWLEKWQAAYPETVGKRLLLLPGRITRLKGHHDLLELLAGFRGKGYHGVIAGGADPKKAPYLQELKDRAKALGVADDISFTGARSDLREIMSISDTVLSLTTQPESFGRTTLEALAIGRPVAGYAHGGVAEQLEVLFPEGKVPVGDVTALGNLLTRWQTEVPQPARENPFTLAAMLEKTFAVYQSLSAAR